MPHAHPPRVQASAVLGMQPEPLEVSQIHLLKDTSCQHPFNVSIIYFILDRALIRFTLTVWSCLCHQSHLLSKLLEAFIQVFPFLPHAIAAA